ncbi:MAG: alpha-amylase family glycosyl hydrolase [Candidatus Nanoarchaeia archaeon]|nr:alpha-amylase family glycosyl hydrolase [Candidatus Nanoarchaeia archaeon]
MNKIKLIEDDKFLLDYKDKIINRINNYKSLKEKLIGNQGFKLSDFANGYKFFGFNIEDEFIVYREWAPNALQLFLTGDFNNWSKISHPLVKKGGYWEIKLLKNDYYDVFLKNPRVKVIVFTKNTEKKYRIPLYINRVFEVGNNDFVGEIYFNNYKWNDDFFFKKEIKNEFDKDNLIIYETHIGMAQEKESVGSFKEFKEIVLPKIKELGYNAIQIMGIMEHPYYGSFGYQVSNFFAVSSRFGTNDDLKDLINEAHKNEIRVLIDVVHSHAVKNTVEGINEFDGSDEQFFTKEDHPAWDTKLFNYASHDVLHFLLSNIKYWIEEYHFDGFRFDGVTSMLYKNHGLGIDFDNYSKYFDNNLNIDALNYLTLANELIKELNPYSISICEDMSGMPGMCYKIKDGGFGFDYRLNMGLPDFFEKLPEKKDEDINMHEIWYQLINRRKNEKNIGYVESHDQALVGGKTLIFRLMDKEMYYHMKKDDKNLIVDRGMALHKIYRLLVISLGGEGYLNFMGNEFGHPEWIDFPREGNNWSYKYAQRKWSLSKDKNLKYFYLNEFDKDMIKFVKNNKLLNQIPVEKYLDNQRKILVYEKKNDKDTFLFCLNLNHKESFTDLKILNVENGKYEIVFNTDNIKYLGNQIIDESYIINVDKNEIILYFPARTFYVLKKIS